MNIFLPSFLFLRQGLSVVLAVSVDQVSLSFTEIYLLLPILEGYVVWFEVRVALCSFGYPGTLASTS